jgi:hypothetical protein
VLLPEAIAQEQGERMPVQKSLAGTAFDPAAVQIMTSAFDEALAELHLDRGDIVAEIVARNIIKHAQAGERDVIRLRELATQFLRD